VHDDFKLVSILTKLDNVEGWAKLANPARNHSEAITRISTCFEPQLGPEKAHDLAFHLTDWIADSLGLIAVCLDPDSFSCDEVKEISEAMAIHANHHLMAATFLQNLPLRDVFNLGLSIEQPSE
jgi:hypothetical protein